jgi:hypothetical protein
VAAQIANRSMCSRHGEGEGGDTRKAFRGQSISAADALTVSLHNPIQFKLPFALRTRARIRTLIAQRFSVKLSLVSVGRLLAQLGQSSQRPLFRAYQQDRSLVERGMKGEFPKMRARAKREKAEVFFGDESGVRSDFHSGTTRAPRGKTPVVRDIGQGFSLNMVSAVSPRGELRFMAVRGGVGADVIIGFLKRLIHGQRHLIFLVVDGHPSHRAMNVKAFVESLQGRLRSFFLPPSSPDRASTAGAFAAN